MANKQRSFGAPKANNLPTTGARGSNENQGNNKRDANKHQSLIGQSCTVRLGHWKGHQGIVKDADDKTVRLELTSKPKIITLPREQVDLGFDPDGAGSTSGNASLQGSLYLLEKCLLFCYLF